MTPTAQQVLDVARSRLESDGRLEQQWWGFPSITAGQWCDVFVDYVLVHAGFATVPGTDNKGSASVPVTVQTAIDHGWWRDPKSYIPKPGDSIVYTWHGGPHYSHIGFVEFFSLDVHVHTIEGNSPDPVEGDIEVERHIVGPGGDREFEEVEGYIQWPLAPGDAPMPPIAPQINPPLSLSGGLAIVAWDTTRDGKGFRMLSDDGHVYDFGCKHYGSPFEDPAHDNWLTGHRHGAKIVNNTAGGFDVFASSGEHYGPYGPH